MTFKKSYLKLKEINDLLISEEILDIDKILKLQQEAEKNYKICEKELKKVE